MRRHRQAKLQARAEGIAEGLRDAPREPDDMRGDAFEDGGEIGRLVPAGFGECRAAMLEGRFDVTDESELDRPAPARRGFGAFGKNFEPLVNRLGSQYDDPQRLLRVRGRATVASTGSAPGCSAATIRASG